MGSLEVSPAADVLVYEVVDESARTRAQLHYFLVDGTAAVFGGGGRAPTAFRLGAGPGDRAPLFAAGAGRRRLGPVDLAVGARAVAAGRTWRVVDAGTASTREYYRRLGRPLGRRPAAPGARVGVVEDVATFYGDDGVERIRVRCFPRDATVEVLSADGKRVRVSRRATEDDPPFADVLRAAARGGGVATFGGLTCRLTSWDAAADAWWRRVGSGGSGCGAAPPPAPLDAGDEKTLRFRGHLADAAGAGAAVALWRDDGTLEVVDGVANVVVARARYDVLRPAADAASRWPPAPPGARPLALRDLARGGAVRIAVRGNSTVTVVVGGAVDAVTAAELARRAAPPARCQVATLNGEPADAAVARADAEAVAARLVADGGGGADAARCLARLALRLRDGRVNARALARTTGLLAAAAADGVVSHDRFVAFVACDLERAIEAAARRRRVAAAAADAAAAVAAARRRDDGETEAAAAAAVVARAFGAAAPVRVDGALDAAAPPEAAAASAGAAPVRVDDALDALALCAAAPRALGAACAAAADGAGAVERSCHALRCGLARRCVGFADAATVRFRLRRRDAARTGVLSKDPFLAALRSCGLHRDFVDERAIDGLASHFAPPPDAPPGAFVAYESFCDALYLCDFDGAWPLVAAASPPARAPPPAFPAAPPSEAEARAQRALARALGGRAHRRRALRARLAAVADGAPAARCFVCRAAFVAAATRFFDECGVDVTRDAVARFADAAFRVHDHLAVDDVLAAAASLEGPRATASLATAAAAAGR